MADALDLRGGALATGMDINDASPTEVGPELPSEGDALLAAGGDVEAFIRLYREHLGPVYRYLYARLGNRTDAEDATQEAFLQAYRALPAWRSRGSGERAWLFSIAHNEVVDRHRARARKPQTALDDAIHLYDQSPSPEQVAVTTGDLDEALSLLGQLSDDQRRVMELRLVGLSGAEIAGVLGKPHATVRKLQERALHRLTELRLAHATRGGELS